jgi:hypothetical protein
LLRDDGLANQVAGNFSVEKYLVLNPRIIGSQRRRIGGGFDDAGDSGTTTLDDGQDATFGTAIALPDLERDFVSVHGDAAIARRDEDVVASVVALHKAEAAGMNQDSSIDSVGGKLWLCDGRWRCALGGLGQLGCAGCAGNAGSAGCAGCGRWCLY